MDVLTFPGRARRPWLLPLALCLLFRAHAAGGQFDEYDVKAAFLLNFTKFVEWPGVDESRNLVICIVGDDPFGTTIDRMMKGKSAQKHPLEVRRLNDALDAPGCHIAFVRSAEREKASKLLDRVAASPVLTIGEAAEFAESGGVVSLSVRDGRVSMVINTAAAQRANLKISAKLLSLARLLPDANARN